MALSFEEAREILRQSASSKRDKGSRFEYATIYFLENDPLWSQRFSDVWTWNEAPTNDGQDIGIDVVARDSQDGSLWAIQCKFYDDDATLTYKGLSTFFSTAAAKQQYTHYMIVDTANEWTSNLRKVAEQYKTVRIDTEAIVESDLDWEPFINGRPAANRTFHELRPHQREAVDDVLCGYEAHDRGKLIMACGTGKTLTSLRLAEELRPEGGSLVLFLAPSISLVAQTLRAWANQSKQKLRPFVVCSDKTSSKIEDAWETSVEEIPYPATTDPTELYSQIAEKDGGDALTVIFATYQSIQVIIDAQVLGLSAFDLIVCDEAHRTTGVHQLMQSPEEQSNFTKVHDDNLVKGNRRLYMTATPRVYGNKAIKQAKEESYEISSMDDESVFGPEFHYLSFGRAVDEGLLTDYKVVALTVDEEMASQIYQQTMTAEDEGFQVPEAAKIIGCWKGLASRSGDVKTQNPDETIGRPLKNAVAFCTTIKESERMAEYFTKVVEAYRERADAKYDLVCEAQHVDGKMNSTTKKRKLTWLAEDTSGQEQNVCRILSNARCLAEGVDVPNLDAILFMKPRKSQIDIVQAVGRVMRKFPGKDYGYIILPIVVPAGTSPEAALDSNEAFSVVWQVLQALRSHDERLDARINALSFEKLDKNVVDVEIVPGLNPDDEGIFKDNGPDNQLRIQYTVEQWQDKVNAQIVKRCGTKVYWEDWADDISKIAVRHIKRIGEIIYSHDEAQARFETFLTGLRDSLNPGISINEAIEMLAQHVITLPVFEALFEGASFAQSNPVSIAMEEMLASLRTYGLSDPKDQIELRELYRSVETRASVIKTDAGRQKVIKELYEGFFSKAFKATSQKMGIVYTPNEVVDYILHATNNMLQQEFGQSLADKGVHILDPFTGTGTFIVNLIQSNLISDEQLPYKYASELHANELLLLAYYIATINIEHAYHSRIPGEYTPFPGAVLTDTFQMTEEGDTLDIEVFTENSERVLAQNELPITVIVGNPPYSVGQKNEDDNNKNASYPTLDKRISDKYAKRSSANLKNSLYDSYIRAFRWATDRIGNRGIISYVTNAGWVDGSAMDGFRKSLVEEFTSIYVLNLRGNQRTQGEESRKEGGKIFGSGSRAPIAITILVKNPDSVEHGIIHYHDIGDYLSREDKLAVIRRCTPVRHFGLVPESKIEWQTLAPDIHGDWLNARDDSFILFAPIGMEKYKEPTGIFETWSRGCQTGRDSWVYNFSRQKLHINIENTIEFYNQEIERWCKAGKPSKIADFVSKSPEQISWTESLLTKLKRNQNLVLDDDYCVALYRPFMKQNFYFAPDLIHRCYQQSKLFPTANHQNIVISVTGIGAGVSFSTLITDCIPNLHMQDTGQCFPFYWYEEQERLGGLFAEEKSTPKYKRHEAITDEALGIFQKTYPTQRITKEDIFYYIYGVFHGPDYRSRFSANLKKELPRIPLAKNFKSFMLAGRKLADLHLNYESINPWPLKEIGNSSEPGKVAKLRFGKKGKAEDKSVIIYNENLMLTEIPESAHRYVVNGKTALGWLLDRYQVTTDKASGIVNDPNDYSDDPRYIVDLIKRVVRLSIETMEIVDALPALQELPQPDYWPEAWKLG